MNKVQPTRRASRLGLAPDAQPEIPGTGHVPSAKEAALNQYVLRLKIKQRHYAAAGKEAKEAKDALHSAMEMLGIPRTKPAVYNCGGGRYPQDRDRR